MRRAAFFILVLAVGCKPVADQRVTLPEAGILAGQALAESSVPVRPGVPGVAPFWNGHAHRFIYAPAFDIPVSDQADRYRFSVISGAGSDTLVFEAGTPWEPLSPVWDRVPTGEVELVVEAIREDRVVETVGERKFYRASPYHGPYHPGGMGYRKSAERLFRYLFEAPYIRHWLEHQEPDPAYGLYCYPAKMYSAVIEGMLTFSALTGDPVEREQALAIAKTVADRLISISEPEGSPLAFFPPTYLGPVYADMAGEWRGESLADRMMLIYPATAGEAYLDLYDHTGEKHYFDAAVNIAETYRKTQLENGTWYLLVFLESGKPVAGNFVVPTGVTGFLNRLSSSCGCPGYEAMSDKALLWIKENLAKDFNWEGQFEDQKPSERYRNLSKGQACGYALQLLDRAGDDTSMIRDAEELIRFAEDQFVIWEDPVKGDYWGIRSEEWMTPCVLEQYNFYTPVNASSADMIEVFRAAFEKTGEMLYLAKAIDLANGIVHAQNKVTGHYPTYLVTSLLEQEGWINCMVYTARTILELGDYLSDINLVMQ
jgi:hypothetical protein